MYCRTLDDKEINIWDLDPELVTIERIGAVLARINRYAGHWRVPISVARHSLNVAYSLCIGGHPAHVQLQGLFHDADEAFTQDIPTPLKNKLLIVPPGPGTGTFPAMGNPIPYRQFEDDLRRRIFDRLGIPFPMHEAVYKVDALAYDKELPILRGEVRSATSDPETVERVFITRTRQLFEELTGRAE